MTKLWIGDSRTIHIWTVVESDLILASKPNSARLRVNAGGRFSIVPSNQSAVPDTLQLGTCMPRLESLLYERCSARNERYICCDGHRCGR